MLVIPILKELYHATSSSEKFLILITTKYYENINAKNVISQYLAPVGTNYLSKLCFLLSILYLDLSLRLIPLISLYLGQHKYLYKRKPSN